MTRISNKSTLTDTKNIDIDCNKNIININKIQSKSSNIGHCCSIGKR